MGCGGSKAADEAAGGDDFRVELASTSEASAPAGERRMQVRADDDDDEDDTFDPNDVYPKSATQFAQLREAMLKNAVFSQCTEDQLHALADHFLELELERGEVVVEQGDPGTTFFIVGSGKYLETAKADDGSQEKHEHATGSAFGEVALLYKAPYGSSIQCQKDGTLWALERRRFRHTMQATGASGLAEKAEKFLKPVPILAGLSDAQRISLASCLVELRFEDGEKVVEAGSSVNAMYVIRSGSVLVRKNARTQGDTLVLGETFGDSSLEQQPGSDGQKATHDNEVVAVGPTSVFKLTALAVKEQLGSLGEAIAYHSKRAALETLDDFVSLDAEGQEEVILKTREQGSPAKAVGVILIEGYAIDKSVLVAAGEAAARRRSLTASAKPARAKVAWADLDRKRLLGTGTYGRVYLVSHKSTKQLYALKCMRKGLVVKEKQQQHVLEETRILAMMSHPFILPLVQTYQDPGELYMLIDLALGGELYYLLQKKRSLFDSHARFYSAQVVSIFSYMHSLNVVYRDLKPENLLLDKDGYLKLIDFGFAKVLTEYRTWTMCGTPEYLAPEIILNKGHGFGVDWWCCGILTFELLCGGCPFRGKDMALYRQIIKGKPPYPGQLSLLAKDFMTRLICVDATRRLGCLKRGSTDVKNHPWFLELDWAQLEAKTLKPPHVPKVDVKKFAEAKSPSHLRDDGKAMYPNEDFPRSMFAEFSKDWV